MKYLLLVGLLFASRLFAETAQQSAQILPDEAETPRMKAWRDMHYGMFIHFNINTFMEDDENLQHPSPKLYAPSGLDVDNWVKLAKDSGMKYAVLTAKHRYGFCLWDSKVMWHGKEFDYDVASSGNTNNVIRLFLDTCKKYQITPGIYYCLRDSHAYPSGFDLKGANKYPMPEDYFELVKAQLKELTRLYPECHYYWIDHAAISVSKQLDEIYQIVRGANSNNIVLFNTHLASQNNKASGESGEASNLFDLSHGFGFPTDVVNTEGRAAKVPVASFQNWQGRKYYVGYETCTIAGEGGWFDTQIPKPVEKIFEVYQQTRQCGGNLLLDVGPNRDGTIPASFNETFHALKEKIDTYEKSVPEKSN